MSSDKPRNSSWSSRPALAGHFDTPQPSVAVEVEFGAHSQPGPERATNEDHYLILRTGRHLETLMTSLGPEDMPKRFDEFAYGMVIANGIGTGGERASRLAISTLAHLAVYFGKWNVRIDEQIAQDVIDRAAWFYRDVEATLVQAGRDDAEGLQTTMTAIYTAGEELFFVHVGHARAYICRDRDLLQLTHDHTLRAERNGKLGIVDVAVRPRDFRHILTSTIGRSGGNRSRIDIERCGLMDGDRVLLCTNGLSDVVDEVSIADVLSTDQAPDAQCRRLVDLAVDAGAEDDVTALVGRYRIHE